MSSLSIKFDPPIDPAAGPVTQDWINSIGWTSFVDSGRPEPKYKVRFHIDDQWLEYSPESLGSVLHDLVLIQDCLRREPEGLQIIEGEDILMARRLGDIVQFAEPVEWQRSPKEMPEDLQVYPVGDPIAWEAVDLAFREAIAAAWRQFELSSNLH